MWLSWIRYLVGVDLWMEEDGDPKSTYLRGDM